MSGLLHSQELPFRLTNGNEGRSKHFGASAKFRRECELTLRMTRDKDRQPYTREPFAEPVRVVVTRVLGRGERKWDSSSILRGNYKEIEDSLCSPAIGWFVDDSPKWIVETVGRQDAGRRDEGPVVLVEVFRAEPLPLATTETKTL